MIEVPDAHLQQLGAAVAGEPAEAIVRLQEPPVGADLDATDGEVLEEAAEGGRALATKSVERVRQVPLAAPPRTRRREWPCRSDVRPIVRIGRYSRVASRTGDLSVGRDGGRYWIRTSDPADVNRVL
jgi:hypothetical protein